MKFTLSTAAIVLCAVAGLASAAPAAEPVADAAPSPEAVANPISEADALPEALKPRSCGTKGYCNGGDGCKK